MRRAAAGLVGLATVLAVVVAVGPRALGQTTRPPLNEATVYEIASQLRCVVCQNLSVADSPSEMAQQMRDLVRERLAAGDTPEQVIEYFVDKYGLWILLSPPKRGFNLLVWIMPFAGLAVGLVVVALVVRRWTRRPVGRAPEGEAPDAATHDRIRRELAALDDRNP